MKQSVPASIPVCSQNSLDIPRAANLHFIRDLSLKFIQGRLRAELEAARLKAELAKLQKERPQGDKSRGWTGSRGSPERQPRSEPPAEIRGPVSKRSGLQAAVPLSQRGASEVSYVRLGDCGQSDT
jgi:hypothetical protein